MPRLDLRIYQRLMLAVLPWTLPLAVLLYGAVDTLQEGVRFAALEREGNRIERPLVHALDGLLRLQELGVGARAGAAPDSAAVDDAARATGAALAEVGRLARELAAPLQLDQAGLGKRGHEALSPPALESRWRDLAIYGTAGGQALFARALDTALPALIADVRGLIGHVGDTSNLILDPDLDSYYVMDATLLALPQTLGRLGAAQALLAASLGAPDAPTSAGLRREAAVLVRMLGEADRDRVRASLATALGEDPDFYGIMEQTHLGPAAASARQRLPSPAWNAPTPSPA